MEGNTLFVMFANFPGVIHAASINLELERHTQNLHITKISTPKLVIIPYTGPSMLSSPSMDTTKASFAGRHYHKMEVYQTAM